jgi:hypothetical protein
MASRKTERGDIVEDRFLLDSPAIEAAVKFRGETLYPSRRPGKNSLNEEYSPGAYDGYFLVVFENDTLSVVDGGAPEEGTAGRYYMNGYIRTAKRQAGIKPSAGWLCLRAWAANKSEFSIISAIPNKPEKEGEPDCHPIAYISQKNGVWSVRQISKWEIPQLWTFENCEDGGK